MQSMSLAQHHHQHQKCLSSVRHAIHKLHQTLLSQPTPFKQPDAASMSVLRGRVCLEVAGNSRGLGRGLEEEPGEGQEGVSAILVVRLARCSARRWVSEVSRHHATHLHDCTRKDSPAARNRGCGKKSSSEGGCMCGLYVDRNFHLSSRFTHRLVAWGGISPPIGSRPACHC